MTAPHPLDPRTWPIGETRTVRWLRSNEETPPGAVECEPSGCHHDRYARLVVLASEVPA